MQDKIRNGQVPDVSDPVKAKDLVKRGNYTYEESLRMAKAGTADSILFDIKSQSVTCLCAAGLSAVVSYRNRQTSSNRFCQEHGDFDGKKQHYHGNGDDHSHFYSRCGQGMPRENVG